MEAITEDPSSSNTVASAMQKEREGDSVRVRVLHHDWVRKDPEICVAGVVYEPNDDVEKGKGGILAASTLVSSIHRRVGSLDSNQGVQNRIRDIPSTTYQYPMLLMPRKPAKAGRRRRQTNEHES